MAVTEYLRAAAAQLRRAAQASKSEADDLRRELTLREQELKKTIDGLRGSIQQRGQDLLRIEDNPASNALKAVETGAIAAMEKQIHNLQHTFETERQQMLQLVQQKEIQMNDLNGQASNFENQQG